MIARMDRPPPVALTIAGSDCCSGAGLQADLKTFSAFGVHGLTAVTSVVAETPLAVHEIYPLSPAALQEQVRILLDAYPVAAVKTGMLGSKLHVVAVAEILENRALPLVVDPVMVSSTGDLLLPPDAVAAYRDRLCPLASLITPNLPEARALARHDDEPTAESLAKLLGCAVLLTGGHQAKRGEAVDVLCEAGAIREYRTPWVETASSHGTGCTLSAAITANLARGENLPAAVAIAKGFVTRALRESYAWSHPRSGEEIRAINQLPQATFQEF
jgi:hydroxymethylpyrimidine/phosphomethylpyrimidine kinase